MAKEKEKKQSHRGAVITIIILSILVAIIAAFYAVGVHYYSSHFLPGTTIADLDVGNKSMVYVERHLDKDFMNYEITIIEKDKEETLTAEDIGLAYNIEGKSGGSLIQEILDNQNKYAWPMALIAEKSDECYDAFDTIVNEELFADAIQSLACIDPEVIEEPEPARIEYSDGLYKLTAAKTSNNADYDKVYSAVYDAVIQGKKSIAVTDYYEQPEEVDVEHLQAVVDEANKYLQCDIIVQGTHASAELNSAEIKDFLIFSDEEMENGSYVSLDKSAVDTWVNQNVSGPNYTIGGTRTIETPSSGTITVSGGTYGSWVNVEETTNLIIEKLNEGFRGDIDPVYRVSEQSSENDGVGYTYIDVDITNQTVYLIKNNKVDYTAECVSGLESSDSRKTPDGTYYVSWKTTDWHMEEYDCDVSYWMPIDDSTGIGLHDATWRRSFGGSIYKSNGSHGCINLSLTDAKYFYENTEIGIPVIVHRDSA